MGEGSKKKSIGWVFKTLFLLALAGTLIMALAGTAVAIHFSTSLPKIITVADYRPAVVSRVLGAGGKEEALMGEFYKERRYLIPYEKIPQNVVRAFISAEDDKFFEHQGVNLVSIMRASIANFRAGHVVQGGSTITQQVAKSLLLTPERSFVRKIKEVILAYRIEKNLSKQQILYLYLNQIYLGHGAYGVQAAARNYFHKDISQVTIAESALLAGMPQAPGKYSPHLNPKRAKERQLYVLRRMYENGFITQAQMAEAAALPLKIYFDDEVNTKYASYLVEHIRKYLVEKYGEKAVYEDGLTVSIPTTPELSLAARKAVREGLRAVDKRSGYRGPVRQLKDAAEIEKTLTAQRIKLIQRRLGYSLFTADGRMDPVEAMHAAGMPTDDKILQDGETYEAIVTSIDEKKKSLGVMIGAARAELPIAQMRWAKPGFGDKNATLGKHFEKGDVILVTPAANQEGGLTVALEQTPAVQGALFSIEAQTGNVLAMEGGYDFELSEFNRAVQAQRQAGSAYKPIIYSAAVERGFTPASIIVDSPIVYNDEENGKWKPSNFEQKFYGDTTFRQALIHSRNVPTIKIVQAIQIPYLIEYSKRIGMNTAFNADLSISLGSATASLYDMTRIYALFPRLGRKVTPIFISSVRDRDGRVLEEQKPVPLPAPKAPAPVISQTQDPSVAAASGAEVMKVGDSRVAMPTYPLPDDPDQVMDPRVAYVMTHLMTEVVTYGTGHGAKNLSRPAAGKTGTTNDYLDAWFMGFTPQIVTGAWVGFDNQKPIGHGETGARAALPIWLSFMHEAVKTSAEGDFIVPPGIVFASIDPLSGKLASPNSSKAIKEAFIEGSQPTETGSSGGGTGNQSSSDFFKEDIE